MTCQQRWAEALLDPGPACPAGLTTWNGSDPAKRFAVYRNNVLASLVDALADTFPVTQSLVGESFFRAMTLELVRRAPPRSPVLAFYGRELPAFIATFAPAAPLPYLADVATLEQAYVEAFHAADASPIESERLQHALSDPQRLPELRLALHPSLQVVRSPFAIVSLWAAHQGHLDIGSVDPSTPENAWVLRRGLSVRVLRVSDGDCCFVQALGARRALGEAVSETQDADPAFDLTQCLGQLLREQTVVGIHHPAGEAHEHDR